jgi:hypothetical protein
VAKDSLEQLEKELAVGESLKERSVARVIRDLNQLKWTDAEAETINVVIANLRDLYARLGSA